MYLHVHTYMYMHAHREHAHMYMHTHEMKYICIHGARNMVKVVTAIC